MSGERWWARVRMESAMTAPDERLSWRCELCKAPPNTECVNTITPGRPLPGRRFHHGRAYPPDRQKRKGAA